MDEEQIHKIRDGLSDTFTAEEDKILLDTPTPLIVELLVKVSTVLDSASKQRVAQIAVMRATRGQYLAPPVYNFAKSLKNQPVPELAPYIGGIGRDYIAILSSFPAAVEKSEQKTEIATQILNGIDKFTPATLQDTTPTDRPKCERAISLIKTKISQAGEI